MFSSLSGYIASKEGLTYALATEKVFGLRGLCRTGTLGRLRMCWVVRDLLRPNPWERPSMDEALRKLVSTLNKITS